jgi:hypothetical protein
MFVGSVVLNLWMAGRVIEQSQHQWCSVLTLLTARPVSPPPSSADKVRENQYRFYVNLTALEARFGC